ncbi:hypothetical protein [Leptothoe sp. PORK10 BA2]|uniref:hypothetical protein n=1 Tax=Leptothoe sp. PORK10 BA2 TaxID=3110254 RepID=UPI002B1F8A7C|nr:hypothetical protein [Leptothoe sp. PORK10 BA2]MEA5464774.1 hypothetical protein [Leptothoe sp. PORK10 BA2]
MRRQQSSKWLMMLAIRAVKYFLLSVAGCTISYMASIVLEMSFISAVVIVLLEQILARALILLLCLLAITVITESLRY